MDATPDKPKRPEMPVHWHEIDGPNIAWPTSVFDCDNKQCQRLAAAAQRGTHYELDYIESRVEQARKMIQTARNKALFWELILEAKHRQSGDA